MGTNKQTDTDGCQCGDDYNREQVYKNTQLAKLSIGKPACVPRAKSNWAWRIFLGIDYFSFFLRADKLPQWNTH